MKNTFAEDFFDTTDHVSCPVCGSYNVQTKTTYDKTKGIWVTNIRCLDFNCMMIQ